MLGIKELKEHIEITESTVECPVKGCNKKVDRRRRGDKREDKFKCPLHDIYISPSTFEYGNELDNLLWKDKADLNLFEKIKTVKRESRISRDNSEDAVSWNVFRFLERYNLLSGYLSKLVNGEISNPEIIYWSYYHFQQNAWNELQDGRKEFETRPRKGSEPDIIVKSDNALFFIEAKLKADNNTICKSKNPKVQEKYETGEDNWFSKVFKSDYQTVAIVEKKYELLRFWLIGTWIAKQLNLDFCLVNLVSSEREKDIENVFKKHINENQKRKFMRITWEDVYGCISNSNLSGRDVGMMIRYFRNKTIGYDGNGRLQRAFSIP